MISHTSRWCVRDGKTSPKRPSLTPSEASPTAVTFGLCVMHLFIYLFHPFYIVLLWTLKDAVYWIHYLFMPQSHSYICSHSCPGQTEMWLHLHVYLYSHSLKGNVGEAWMEQDSNLPPSGYWRTWWASWAVLISLSLFTHMSGSACQNELNAKLRSNISPPWLSEQTNICASTRNERCHSAESVPLTSSVHSWKQTGPSSNSTLADMTPDEEKPNKTGLSRNSGVTARS